MKRTNNKTDRIIEGTMNEQRLGGGITLNRTVVLWETIKDADGKVTQTRTETKKNLLSANALASPAAPTEDDERLIAERTYKIVIDFEGLFLDELLNSSMSQTTVYKQLYNNQLKDLSLQEIRELFDDNKTLTVKATDIMRTQRMVRKGQTISKALKAQLKAGKTPEEILADLQAQIEAIQNAGE